MSDTKTSLSDTKSSLKEKLKELKDNYVRQLPGRLQQIQEMWHRAKANKEAIEDNEAVEARQSLVEAHRMVHNLYGSCTTFSLSALTVYSKELEVTLKSLVEDGAALNEEIEDSVKKTLSIIENQIEKLLDGSADTETSECRVPEAHALEAGLALVFHKNPVFMAVLRTRLEETGFSVAPVNTLEELNEAFEHNKPVVAIVDVTGGELEKTGVQRFKEMYLERAANVPLIFISDKSDFKSRLATATAGGTAHFTEPVDPMALIDKIRGLAVDETKESYRILILDDEPDVANFYSLILQDEGMKTVTINDPGSIVSALDEFSPDLILMDMYMPGCTGMDVARVIRQMDEYVSIPIVFLSSETDINKQLRAMSMGGDDFLNKTIQAEHLISSVTIRAERMRIIRSFNKLKDYNQTLEQKVQKRTAELKNTCKVLKEKSVQLEELNKHLEDRVQQEIRQRMEKEQLLIQQSKMAAMGEMLSMIAHQWRQPLSSITTIAANMQVIIELDLIDKDDFSKLLQDINNQSQFLSNTINDFRNFFKPEKKKESVLLGDIMDHTLRIIGKSLEHSHIKVDKRYSFKTSITTYPNELMQVFLNLIKNSKDALLEKSVPYPVISITGFDNGDVQTLEITDNAGGIPHNIMDKIFEPYFSTKESSGGTGLGLYMSKIIVEKHCSGHITAANDLEGARFTVTLPMAVRLQ